MSHIINDRLIEEAIELAEATDDDFIIELVKSKCSGGHIDLEELCEITHQLKQMNEVEGYDYSDYC